MFMNKKKNTHWRVCLTLLVWDHQVPPNKQVSRCLGGAFQDIDSFSPKFWHWTDSLPFFLPTWVSISLTGKGSLPFSSSCFYSPFHRVLSVASAAFPSVWRTGVCVVWSLVMSSSCDPMDGSPPGSSVRGILQARILKWIAMSFSRGPPRPRDWSHVSCISSGIFITEPPGQPLKKWWEDY